MSMATVVARIADVAMVVPGGVCVWLESGVWSQAVGFRVGSFGRNLASVAVKMFHI
jgi:hypothetical protein